MSVSAALWPGETIELGGRRIHLRRDGTGDRAPGPFGRAIYVHGLGGSAIQWTDLMGELREEVAGTALDLPGFGHSPPPPDEDYSLDAYAATLVRLIRTENAPVHLVGNSMGGAVATRVAAEHPELVETLVLVSPAFPEPLPQRMPLLMTAALLPWAGPAVYRRMQRKPPEVRVQDLLEALCYDPSAVPAQRVLDALQEIRDWSFSEHATRATMGALRSMVAEYLRLGSRDLWGQAKEVSCPTLLIYGRHDRFVNSRFAEHAARSFPDNRLVLMARAGHAPMLERPADVAREIRGFLHQTRRAAAGTALEP